MAEEKELKVAPEAKEEKAPAEAPKEARGPRGDRKDRRNKGEEEIIDQKRSMMASKIESSTSTVSVRPLKVVDV